MKKITAFARAFANEHIFQNTYTAEGGPGTIAFTSSFPGEIRAVDITPNNGLIIQKSAWLASEAGVEISTFFQKKLGGDIVDNKKTFLLIKALERAEGKDKEELLNWISGTDFDPEEKITAVKAIYDKVNVREITNERINELFAEAISSLNDIHVEESKKAALHEFANKLLKRKY